MAGPLPGVRTKRLPPPGELHLTPLHGILQLRPSFSYLDKADAKHREREAANEAGDSSQDEADEDVKQVTVSCALGAGL